RLPRGLAVEVGARDPRPLRREQQRARPADARPGARDQRHLIRQPSPPRCYHRRYLPFPDLRPPSPDPCPLLCPTPRPPLPRSPAPPRSPARAAPRPPVGAASMPRGTIAPRARCGTRLAARRRFPAQLTVLVGKL